MTENEPKVTVCVLLYGDYPELAQRCLGPLWDIANSGIIDLRIGCNAISQSTSDYVNVFAENADRTRIIRSEENILKYPMMRRLFDLGPLKPFTMWFDDDSYIRVPWPIQWFKNIALEEMSDSAMLGSLYSVNLSPNQVEWIKAQPWYTGKPLRTNQKKQPVGRFATGGWWTIRSDVLKRFDWPISELKHRGGDVMLGELLWQNNLQLKQYKHGVAINADDDGRESCAAKRGFDSKPIGWDFVLADKK